MRSVRRWILDAERKVAGASPWSRWRHELPVQLGLGTPWVQRGRWRQLIGVLMLQGWWCESVDFFSWIQFSL